MKRHEYRDYIIDVDSLGRLYIYNTASPYAEENDHILINIDGDRKPLQQAKAVIDARIESGQDCRAACIDPHTGDIIPVM